MKIDNIKRKNKITSFFLNKNYKPMTKNEICHLLSIPKGDSDFERILNSLLRNKSINFIDNKYYPVKPVEAIFQYKTIDYGFAICKDKSLEDIYIPSKFFLDVNDKDDIEVLLTNTEGKRRVGKIVKILKRNLDYVVGRVYKLGNKCYVEPFSKNIPSILINENLDEDTVVKVKITDYKVLSGFVVSKIGSIDENNIYVKSLIEEYNLNKDFSDNIDNYIKNISDTVNESDLVNRIDKTNDIVFTIDGNDSKDLDDAIAIKKENDIYKLSVHIADVSHYVQDNSVLDKEAISRATSIYIPNKVVPMLPRKLSNGICSLNKNVLRLTMSIDIDIDKEGNVINSNIYKGYIKSRKKMTYENLYKYIKKIDKDIEKEYSEFHNEISLMLELQKILNNKRNLSGSINFDIPETKIILNDKDEVIDIKPYDITVANKIIEEFMLIANTEVAKTFYNLKLPFMYRIHEKPDLEKLYDLNIVLAKYNKKINNISNITPKDLSCILESIDNEEEKQVISTLMLRTLKLARYSDVCNIHFGLNFENYTHFTSPIRRYPDLFIHRVITDYLNKNLNFKKISKYKTDAYNYAVISTEKEKEATKIERDFDDLYKCIFIKDKIGTKYIARISSITSFGMFVKLDNTIEGLIHISKTNLVYDEKTYTLNNKNKSYSIGDIVTVILDKVDVKLKQIDFNLEEE